MDRPKGISRIIVALDFPSWEKAEPTVKLLGPLGVWFKIGLQLYVAEGPEVVRKVKALGGNIFLDLKFKDIPNTMAGAAKSAAALGTRMFNLHADNTAEAIEAAVKNRVESLVLGVTVLTSSKEADVQDTNGCLPVEAVLKFGRRAIIAGCHGLVCSTKEVVALRNDPVTNPALLVVPGIRLDNSPKDDQARIATPYGAVRAGADFLVVGRPVTEAPDPIQAINLITAEIQAAEKDMGL